MTFDDLSGVIAAVPTPFDAAGRPDTARFVRHCEWALANGCDGLNVLGTTGEANSLSSEDRATVMRAAASAFDRSRLMVGTGTPALSTTIELTRLAAELGFAAALVLPPYYYKPVSEEGLFAWFARVLDALGACPMGLYLDNFPQLTGIRFSPELAARLAAAYPGRLRGIKDSSGDLDYARQVASVEGFDVFPSDEAALAQAGADGYAGCISATVNLTVPTAARLWRNQDDAALREEVRRRRQAIASQPLVPAVKHLIGAREGDSAWDAVLPPLLQLSAAQKAALATSMHSEAA